MRNKKLALIAAALLLVVGAAALGGCSKVDRLIDTAEKNIEIDKTLPVYHLNKQNFKEISYEGRTYQIREEAIPAAKLAKPIGRVSERVTIDENNKILSRKELMSINILPDHKDQKRTDLNFGWVYSITGNPSDKAVAVVINEKYRKATIKK